MLSLGIRRFSAWLISLRAWMIIATLLYSASLFLWFSMFGLSFMAFDAGFAFRAAVFVAAVGLYAPVVLGTIIWAWIAYRQSKQRRAGLIMLVPLAYVVLLTLVLQIGIWIQG